MNKDCTSLKEMNAYEFHECRYGCKNKQGENGDGCVMTTCEMELPEQEG